MIARFMRLLTLLVAISAVAWGARWVLLVRASSPAAATSASAASSVEATRVLRGPFQLSVTATGKLRARTTVTVRTLEGRGQMMMMMEPKLVWIAPDGLPVKKDDVVARLDDADLKRQVRDVGLEYANARADFEKTSRDQALNQRNSQAAVDKAKEEMRILLDSNKVQIKQAQDQLAFSTAELERLTAEYERKKSQQAEKLIPLTDLEQAEIAKSTAAFNKDKAEKDLALQIEKAKSAEQEKQTDIDNAQFTVATAERKVRDAARSAQTKLDDIKRRLDDAQQNLESCTLRAPASGLLVLAKGFHWPDGRRVARAGDQLRPFEPLADIPDLSEMAIDCKVPELQIGAVHLGQPVIVRLDERPAQPYHARVIAISSVAETVSPDETSDFQPGTKVFTVTVLMREHDPKHLLPGMNATLEIVTDLIPNAVSVAKSCIFERGPDHVVYVRRSGSFEPVAVKLGKETATRVRVLSGLHGGEWIATVDPTTVSDR
jgi:multidrug efflux pump subunit AcrA (membrane-fusion protein)